MPEKVKCPECGEVSGQNIARCKTCEKIAAARPREEMLATVDHTSSAPPPQSRAEKLPKEGELLGGYRIIRQLGKGGMGSVYEAEELDSGRRIALKLFGQSLDSNESRQRFLREGRLAASISNPNTVYVFGAEEINGIPAISMELVAGGTLEARVRDFGPLAVGPAVDAILQIIDGLEAAQKIGVLHRDVKASNCFVDGNGVVKVGDFGLSVSTATKTDLKLTTTGAFLGTPSYASPEQLRGQEIDVRSDIYSVGVTLFYLLTGKIPFEADSFVQLIAAVLEQPTPLASNLRKDVPRELAAVISRCLEKQPARRFQSYKDLRYSLQPFTTNAPLAAGIPIRIFAGVLDSCVLFCVSLFQMGIASNLGANPFDPSFMGSTLQMKIYAISAVWTIGYFVFTESLFGATIGKALCGLRVIDAKRGRPSLLAAIIRAVIYYTAPCIPTWILIGFRAPMTGANSLDLFPIAMALSMYPMLALLFSTARRRNGNAALQDLASGTRVILKPESNDRPIGAPVPTLTVNANLPREQVGPYQVTQKLDDAWEVGYDEKLARNVWIHRCDIETPLRASQSSQHSRPGRLRWLGGKRETGQSWDAFEAAPGAAFRDVISQPCHWESVRYWLMDLSEELAASKKDCSVPSDLSLDRIWITSDNRAKLLDFPAPGAPRQNGRLESKLNEPVPDDAPRLLWTVAASALSGKLLDDDAARKTNISASLPLHASDFLDNLKRLPPIEATAIALRDTAKKRVRVTHTRRFALVLACIFFPLLTALIPLVLFQFTRQWQESMPNISSIHALMFRYADVPFMTTSRPEMTPALREAIEVVIASKYAGDIKNPQIWNTFYAQSTLPQWERDAAEKIIATCQPATGEKLEQAEAEVQKYLQKHPPKDIGRQLNPPFFFLSTFITTLLVYVAFPALLAALMFRGGLLLAFFGLVVVDRTGRPAARWRVVWRTVAVWSIAPTLLFLVIAGAPMLGYSVASIGAIIAYAGICIVSVLLPQRGLADRIAGTELVLR